MEKSRLKAAREAAGFTQMQLVEAVNDFKCECCGHNPQLSVQGLRHYEQGIRNISDSVGAVLLRVLDSYCLEIDDKTEGDKM